MTYTITTDPRFELPKYEIDFVNLLDKHGFPVIAEQPKNVHKIGKAFGNFLDHYVEEGTQLFVQGRLSLAVGLDLDNFGSQFGVPRRAGESDDNYRTRLQAVFSPRKVTEPNIQLVLNQIADTDVTPFTFTPWRYVFRYDDVDCSYDIGDWYYWSPDYWRSGVLVIKSDLTDSLYGTVESLVSMGVQVLYDLYYRSHSDIGFELNGIGYYDVTMTSESYLDYNFFYDRDIPGAYDSIQSDYDLSAFSQGLEGFIVESAWSLDMQFDDVAYFNVQSVTGNDQILFVLDQTPGSWMQLQVIEAPNELFSLSDSLNISFGLEDDLNNSFSLSSFVVTSADYVSTVSETLSLTSTVSDYTLTVSIMDSITLTDSVSEILPVSVTLSSGKTLNDGDFLAPTTTTSLSNPYNYKLNEKLRLS